MVSNLYGGFCLATKRSLFGACLKVLLTWKMESKHGSGSTYVCFSLSHSRRVPKFQIQPWKMCKFSTVYLKVQPYRIHHTCFVSFHDGDREAKERHCENGEVGRALGQQCKLGISASASARASANYITPSGKRLQRLELMHRLSVEIKSLQTRIGLQSMSVVFVSYHYMFYQSICNNM